MTHGQKKIRFAWGLSGVLFSTTATLIACGGDDTTIGQGGQDAGTDGTIVNDGGPHVDGGDAGDGAVDGSPGDGSADGSTDSGDAAADADVSAALLEYANNLAVAYCTNLQARCATYDAGAGVDAGKVDITACKAASLNGSSSIIDDSTLGLLFPNALGHNDITYDVDAGARCINDIATLDLTNEQSATYKQVLADCFAVSHGTLPLNSPCYTSLECAPSSWCQLGLYDAGTPDAGTSDAGDGGDGAVPVPPPTGLCVALLDAGASCDSPPKIGDSDQTNNYAVSGVSCSYLGQSGNGAFCDTYATYAADSTCISGLLDIGESCPNNESCASSICDILPDNSDAFCRLSTNTLSGNLCSQYPAAK